MLSRIAVLPVCAVSTLSAALLAPPDAAYAGVLPSVAAPTPASASCRGDEVTSADRAVADRVRPAMNGRRLGRAVSAGRIACARDIVRAVQARGLPQRAAVIAVTTAIAESTLLNHTVALDHDSLGLFQQRPSMGWGRPDQLVDPRYATNAFLDKLIRKYPGDAWMTGDIGQICQRVQISAVPGAYTPEVQDAARIVAELWTRSAVPTVPPAPPAPANSPATAAEPAKQPDGPFQRLLSATYTGLGPTDDRHHMAMADWNGDRRADLVVVQGSDTATGKTEVHIMNGATNFQSLLLHTITALGPTDQRHAFSLADWNADGKPDLVAVQKSGTASGKAEVRVLDGATAFRRVLVETTTAVDATDQQHAFAVADWNADGKPDLLLSQNSGTASKKTEVRILDGASQLQRDLQPPIVTAAATDGVHEVFVTDWNNDTRPDLAVVQTSGTTSGKTDIQVLDGTDPRRSLLQGSTALGPLEARHELSVADWDGDGKPDLVVVQKSGTASGRTEALALAE